MYSSKKNIALFIVIFIMNSKILYAQNTFLDSTFNNVGKVVLPLSNSYDVIREIQIQNDGKIIAAGYYSNGNGDDDFAVARFNIDGSLDVNFGNLGISKTTIGNSNDNCLATKIQTDGKILLGGSSINGNIVQIALIRYNSNGNLDNSFGNNGIVLTQIDNTKSYCSSIDLQSDGKIVVGGYSSSGGGNIADFVVIRYLINGIIDSSFGVNGVVITDIKNIDEGISLAIQFDGKILLSGFSSNDNSDYDCTLVRYNTNGTLDLSFGIGGKKISDINNNTDFANALAIQSDGKILIAGGTINNGVDYDFLILRHNVDGNLDSTFGNNGIVVLPIGNSDEMISSILIQSDGKIVAAGYTKTDSNTYHFALSRFTISGNLDSTFGNNGIIKTSFGSIYEAIYSIAFQNDGKIIAAGYSGSGADFDFAISRYINSTALGFVSNTFILPKYHFYPNPFKIQTNLDLTFCPHNATLLAFNEQGKIVKNISGINNSTISFHKGILPPGLYFIKVYENNQLILTEKITISN